MSEVAPKFLEFIGDSPIVAHNGFDFDFPFINYEFAKLGLPQISRAQQMDSIVNYMSIFENKINNFEKNINNIDLSGKFKNIDKNMSESSKNISKICCV